MLVPGHAYDLFLSYAHIEAEWVKAFEKAFCQQFHEREGKAISIWQDANNLRLGQKWTAEIEEGVRQAAALLAIVSPSYHTSDWCQKERNLLFKQHGGIEGLKVDAFYRFLKIDKAPSDHDLYKELQTTRFFNKATGEEFPTDSREFSVAIGNAVRDIQELLRLMSNGQTSLYLARGPMEMADDRKQLEEELTGRGYKVRPGFALDAGYGTEKLVKEMEPCSRTIFLLGGEYDSFVENQMKQAVALNKPAWYWIHPRLAEKATPEQRRLLERIRERQANVSDVSVPAGELLGGASISALWKQIEPLLKKDSEPASPAKPRSGQPRVYLIFDATLSAESEAAVRLSGILSERNLQVIQAKRHDDHDDLMHCCEAALLLRTTKAEAEDWWLRLYARDVILSKEIVAKGFLLADPGRLTLKTGDVPVLQYADPLPARVLEPFFEKLARARSADAGR
jgi:hypothetical protein